MGYANGDAGLAQYNDVAVGGALVFTGLLGSWLKIRDDISTRREVGRELERSFASGGAGLRGV